MLRHVTATDRRPVRVEHDPLLQTEGHHRPWTRWTHLWKVWRKTTDSKLSPTSSSPGEFLTHCLALLHPPPSPQPLVTFTTYQSFAVSKLSTVGAQDSVSSQLFLSIVVPCDAKNTQMFQQLQQFTNLCYSTRSNASCRQIIQH